MKIVVPVKLVPDLVEELTIDPSGTALDTTWLRVIINEFDDHAIEQAILLKERSGGYLTVITPDAEGVDDMLFTAAAKGVDKLIKLAGDFEGSVNNHALARAIVPLIMELQPDLILIGVQANNDLDGSLGALAAEYLGMPYVGYVSGLSIEGDKAIARKEYPGGLVANVGVKLPAVLGIQAAEQPPRYVAISKVRQMMKTATIEEYELSPLDQSGGATIARMYQPEVAEKATMISGNIEETADKFIAIFRELGVL
jgi:electron transfer flavoprotein beta subunit